MSEFAAAAGAFQREAHSALGLSVALGDDQELVKRGILLAMNGLALALRKLG